MKILCTLFFSLFILIANTVYAGENRWLEIDNANTNASWFVDSRTLQVNDNKTVSFWAKVVINKPKYDIVEIKLKYLLSADKLQLTKLQEIGFNNKNEILWNNNLTKSVSIIPGSCHEKLVLFIEDYVQKKEEAKKAAQKQNRKKDREETETNAVSAQDKSPQPSEQQKTKENSSAEYLEQKKTIKQNEHDDDSKSEQTLSENKTNQELTENQDKKREPAA